MNNFDFAIQVGPTAPEGEPKSILKTDVANTALHHAYQWAVAKASTSMNAGAAKVYIEAIKMNREYEPNNPDRADYTQLLYIIGNLTGWRGEHSKDSRKALKAYAESINTYR